MRLNNSHQPTVLLATLLSISIFFPTVTYGACGLIPSTYPIFSASKINLDKDITVNGNTVDKDKYEPNAGIDANGIVTENISLTLPDLDPSSLPSNNSSEKLKIESSTTIDHSSEKFYEEIKIAKKELTVNFTGGGPFHIGKLIADEKEITLNFDAGIYYFNEFKLRGNDIKLNIINGPVIFHIGEVFLIDGKDVDINPGGSVENFLVYLHSGAKFKNEKNNLDFTGLIYGPNNVNQVEIDGNDNIFHGAVIISGGDVKIDDKDFSFIYTAADQTAVGNISTCKNNEGISKLVLNLRMEEDSWNGSANEVVDSSGFNNSGTAHGGITPKLTNPAIPGDPGTCGYAEFDGTSNSLIEIPHNDNLNGSQALTYMAWVNGNTLNKRLIMTKSTAKGKIKKLPQMTLRFDNKARLRGYARLSIPITLQTDPSKTLSKKTWHHLALVFSSDALVLYIDGVEIDGKAHNTRNQTLEPSSTSVIIGKYNRFLFKGSIDEVRIYTQALTQSQILQAMNETHACSDDGGGGGDTAATIFNCVENGADGLSGKLFTKTTAQSFSFDIVALQDASTLETNFASGADHTVTVELVNAETAVSCDSYPALNPAVSQSLTMLSSDSGIKASVAMRSNTAYKAVKCRVTDTTDSPSVIGCSTDSFAIRPTEFTISSNLSNVGSTGTPKAKAGESFTLTATATTGYNGTPAINNSNIQAHSGGVTGNISGSFSAADPATGIATGTAFSYSEVGSLQFTAEGIYDENFTAIDQSNDCTDDFSNTVDGSGKVGCKFGNTAISDYFGRFTPDHFVLSNKNFEDRINLSCTPGSIFSYIGEAFQTSFTLTAENSGNITTQNYTGSFAKLGGSDFNFGAIDLADAVAPTSATALSSQLGLVSTTGSWTNGIANMTATLGVTRTSPEGPFESFSLGIAPTDSDGIILSSYDLDTSVPSDSNDRELLATTKIRFGRLNINNTHGSELLPLAVPVYTEYFNGTTFVTNTDDTCTPISVSQLGFNGGTNPITVGSGTSTASIANSPLAQGKAGLSLSAPGANNTGFVDITSNIFITSYPWLKFDWDGDGNHDNSPSARATFGIYKGNSKQIYFREVY